VVYLVAVGPDSGYGLYRDNFDSTRVVRGLHFVFCNDGGSGPGPGLPDARYLPRAVCPLSHGGGTASAGALPGRAKGGGPAGAEAVAVTSDGWMACLTGCCRFLGPPSGPGAEVELVGDDSIKVWLPTGELIVRPRGPD
jgi:hypothetical protein